MANLVRRDGIPLYYQVREFLDEKILNGEWKPGKQIPTEAELESFFGVSKSTVRQAVGDLVQRGKLVKRQGSGTFVAEPKIDLDIENAHLLGEPGEHRLLGIAKIPAPRSVAEKLDLAPGDAVFEVSRVRLVNGESTMHQRSWIPVEMCSDLDKRDLTKPLYEYVKESGKLKSIRIQTFLEPVIVRDDEAHILGVKPGTPALLLERTIYSQNNLPVMITKSIVRGDRCRVLVGDRSH